MAFIRQISTSFINNKNNIKKRAIDFKMLSAPPAQHLNEFCWKIVNALQLLQQTLTNNRERKNRLDFTPGLANETHREHD